MANSLRLIIFLSLVSLLPVVAESSEYELFAPTAQEGEQTVPERGKGVLVRRITIKPGDTLSRISRNFSGKGSYFPRFSCLTTLRILISSLPATSCSCRSARKVQLPRPLTTGEKSPRRLKEPLLSSPDLPGSKLPKLPLLQTRNSARALLT